jgi:glutathione S-transferase
MKDNRDAQHAGVKKERDNRDGKSPSKGGKGGKIQVDGTDHKKVGTLIESAEFAPTALDKGDPNYVEPTNSPSQPPNAPVPSMSGDTKLELIYFDIPGKAEAIRLAAAVGNVPLEDVRVTRDKFREMKTSGELPYGQVPALRVDGTLVIAQSAAIIRFIGKLDKTGKLYPTDPVRAAIVDSIVAQENDMFTGVSCSRYQDRFGFDGALGGKGSENTLMVEKALKEVVLPKHLSFFERLLQDSPTIWIAGTEGPSIADFTLVPRLQWIGGEIEGLLDNYPGILALISNVMGLPEVVAYYESKE